MYFNFPLVQMGKFAFFYFRICANAKRAALCRGRLLYGMSVLKKPLELLRRAPQENRR